MSVGIILEEPSAEPFVKNIAERLRISIETRISRGKGNLKRKLMFYAEGFSSNCNKVIVLVDSHCSDPSTVEQDFQNEITSKTPNIHICVVVHALESWLLGDSEALSRKLRTRNLRTPPNPETICKPEEELDRLFNLYNKSYLKNRDVEGVIRLANLDIIAHTCHSFQNFIDYLRDC